jgi:hypothetical protein
MWKRVLFQDKISNVIQNKNIHINDPLQFQTSLKQAMSDCCEHGFRLLSINSLKEAECFSKVLYSTKSGGCQESDIKTFESGTQLFSAATFALEDFWTSATNEGAYSDFNYGWCGDGKLFNTNDLPWDPWDDKTTRRFNPHNCIVAWFNETGFQHVKARPCETHRSIVFCEHVPRFSEKHLPTRGPKLYPFSGTNFPQTSVK